METKVYDNSLMKSSGYIILKQARVNWFLSIDRKDLPETSDFKDQRSHRSIKINGVSLNFDNGFEDLHTMSYSQILSGKGFGIDEVGQVIDLVSRIRLTD
ncbi:MAG: UDP-N-acetyl-2-amino-2-deoxyglucuronate dehydrogenase [Saprospiraceae bacterium]